MLRRDLFRLCDSNQCRTGNRLKRKLCDCTKDNIISFLIYLTTNFSVLQLLAQVVRVYELLCTPMGHTTRTVRIIIASITTRVHLEVNFYFSSSTTLANPYMDGVPLMIHFDR